MEMCCLCHVKTRNFLSRKRVQQKKRDAPLPGLGRISVAIIKSCTENKRLDLGLLMLIIFF